MKEESEAVGMFLNVVVFGVWCLVSVGQAVICCFLIPHITVVQVGEAWQREGVRG